MTSTEIKTVAGRPVVGQIPTRHGWDLPEQKTIEQFVEALDKLFAFPEVEAVRWQEHTPSWNDGDVCVFGVGDVYVKLVGVDEGGDYEDGYFGEWSINSHFSSFEDEYTWRDGKHHPIAKVLDQEFGYKSISAYYTALEDAFGDPAEVVATREGFQVDHYDESY